jgi:23S rRNA G2069 N7-methylase RlmK/C1962 C5-methylase RlmI
MTELLNRLKKNLKRMKGKLSTYKVECFRLYERDLPNYSFIVDCYAHDFVVYDRHSKIHDFEDINLKKKELTEAIKALDCFSIDSKIFWKVREVQKGKKQYENSSNDYEKIVSEGEVKFYVNLGGYLDTGLFLDHRPLRTRVHSLSQGKRVLNLFSYTCSISVYAALGGGSVTSVDLSAKYLEWGKKNFTLNSIVGDHEFKATDCKAYLENCTQRFDLIILDPPTFSNSKKTATVLDIKRDHEMYIHLCMDLLNEGGILFFSCNRRDFKMNELIETKYHCENTSKKTIPFDFRDMKIHKSFEITHRI